MAKFVLALLLGLHGLIHLAYVAPAPPDPKYPFNLSKSWLITSMHLGEPTVRSIGLILSVITVLGLVLAGLAAVGFIIPQSWGQPLTVIGALASLVLLILFWHSWLIIGIVIDIALIVALLWLNWQPFAASGV